MPITVTEKKVSSIPMFNVYCIYIATPRVSWRGMPSVGLPNVFRENGIIAQSLTVTSAPFKRRLSAIIKFDTTNSIAVFFAFYRPDDSPRPSEHRLPDPQIPAYLWPEARP